MKILLTVIITFLLIPLQGQRLVKDLSPGSGHMPLSFYGSLKNGFIFVCYSEYGYEPWISDGTAAGTKMIKDINPGQNSSLSSSFYYFNDTIMYFTGRVVNENYLWRTDGTAKGTYQVFKFEQNLPNNYYNEGVMVGKYLYFSDPKTTNTLWRTDGSVSGTQKVYEFKDSGLNTKISLNYHNGTLYIFAADKLHGTELWTSDGTEAGTKFLKDINPGQSGSIISNRTKMVALKNKLYFGAQGSNEEGYELYETDGTEEGTVLFIDLETQKFLSSFPTLYEGNDSFFIFNTQGNQNKAWKSDGTVSNTKGLLDSNINSFIHNITPFKRGNLINMFTSSNGSELYLCDNNFNNTTLVKDINPELGSSYTNGQTIILQNKAYFVAFNNMLGNDIWVSDGTYDSTLVYLELIGNIGGEAVIEWNDRIFFNGMIDPSIGMELYELIPSNQTNLNRISINSKGIFPNPVQAGHSITLSETECSFILYNMIGQVVLEGHITDGKCLIPEQVKKGLYSIKITSSENETHHKIVIE